jgi:hypothetical protein
MMFRSVLRWFGAIASSLGALLSRPWRSRFPLTGMHIEGRRLGDAVILEVRGTIADQQKSQALLAGVMRDLADLEAPKVILSLAAAKLGRPEDFSDFIVRIYNELPKGAESRLKCVTDRGPLEHHLMVWFGVDGSEALFEYYDSVKAALGSFAKAGAVPERRG